MEPRRYVVLGLWVLTVDAWFQGPIVGGWAGPPAVVPLVVALLATLVRLPALAAPASLTSSDSAVAGIIAQELAAGQRPAPIDAPGFPYEGTLTRLSRWHWGPCGGLRGAARGTYVPCRRSDVSPSRRCLCLTPPAG